MRGGTLAVKDPTLHADAAGIVLMNRDVRIAVGAAAAIEAGFGMALALNRHDLEGAFGRKCLSGILLIILIAGAIMLRSLPASSQDLPPLRDDQRNLKNMPWGFQPHVRHPEYYALRADPFGAIAPHISGLETLDQFGLVRIPEDASALSDFLQLALATRLRELGIEHEVQVRPQDPFARLADCGILGMAVRFDARKAVHDSRPVVIVVVSTVLWQLTPEPGLSKSASQCSGRPPLTEPGPTDVFVVEPNESEKTLALSREVLLSIVDHAILYQLVLTNPAARERVRSWVR
jgi:hypothetical protein